MYKIKSLVLALFAELLLIGCAATTPVPTTIPAPTAVPTSVTVTDPAAIVQGFWDAINARDMNAAKAFLADDVQCTGDCSYSGKDLFYINIVALVAHGEKIEIKDLKIISDDTVTFTVERFDVNGILSTNIGPGTTKAQVKDGKIILMEVPF